MGDIRSSSATLPDRRAGQPDGTVGRLDVDSAEPLEAMGPGVTSTPAASPRTITLPALPWRHMAGFALFGVAGLIALFLVYLLAFTPLTAARDQQRLANSLKGHPLTVYKLVNGRLPPQGSAVAVLQIPSIGVDQVVVQGTSAADLMNGPGLMPGTSLPGSPGNSVIAGRRTTFGGPFGEIGSLRPGAKIRVVDGAGAFAYKVTSVHQVAIGQRDVVLPTRDNRLTLVTSDSSVVTGGREVVRAKLIGRAVAVPDSTVSVPSYDLGLSGDPAAGGLAAMWSFLTLMVLVAAAYAAWRLRRPWLVYLFMVPVVLMCGLFACQSVARALPATF